MGPSPCKILTLEDLGRAQVPWVQVKVGGPVTLYDLGRAQEPWVQEKAGGPLTLSNINLI